MVWFRLSSKTLVECLGLVGTIVPSGLFPVNTVRSGRARGSLPVIVGLLGVAIFSEKFIHLRNANALACMLSQKGKNFGCTFHMRFGAIYGLDRPISGL